VRDSTDDAFLRILCFHRVFSQPLRISISEDESQSKLKSRTAYELGTRVFRRIPECLGTSRRLGKAHSRISLSPKLTEQIKTIQNSSLLYKRATEDAGRYRGRSRADFETLHQSIHEYRIVDRSDQHLQQISHADRNSARREEEAVASQVQVASNMGAAVNASVPDPFPNWWSMLQEVEFTDVGNLWNGMREL